MKKKRMRNYLNVIHFFIGPESEENLTDIFNKESPNNINDMLFNLTETELVSVKENVIIYNAQLTIKAFLPNRGKPAEASATGDSGNSRIASGTIQELEYTPMEQQPHNSNDKPTEETKNQKSEDKRNYNFCIGCWKWILEFCKKCCIPKGKRTPNMKVSPAEKKTSPEFVSNGVQPYLPLEAGDKLSDTKQIMEKTEKTKTATKEKVKRASFKVPPRNSIANKKQKRKKSIKTKNDEEASNVGDTKKGNIFSRLQSKSKHSLNSITSSKVYGISLRSLPLDSESDSQFYPRDDCISIAQTENVKSLPENVELLPKNEKSLAKNLDTLSKNVQPLPKNVKKLPKKLQKNAESVLENEKPFPKNEKPLPEYVGTVLSAAKPPELHVNKPKEETSAEFLKEIIDLLIATMPELKHCRIHVMRAKKNVLAVTLFVRMNNKLVPDKYQLKLVLDYGRNKKT